MPQGAVVVVVGTGVHRRKHHQWHPQLQKPPDPQQQHKVVLAVNTLVNTVVNTVVNSVVNSNPEAPWMRLNT